MPHDAYFQGNPTRLDVSRSKMRARPRWTGSWSVGSLFPIFATSSIMPGDTFKMSVASAIRMVRPVAPVMDDMEITIEAYFVPHRLILSRKSMSPDLNDSNHSWQAFIGAQDSLLNMPAPGDVTLPQFYVSGSLVIGGLADCLGFANPSGGVSCSYKVNCLKPLAFYSIWNEYFREPNTQAPVTYSISSGGLCQVTGSDAGVPASDTQTISLCPLPPVSRYHGYFGSALPWPQRNSTQVEMPLGDLAPVVAGSTFHSFLNTPLAINASQFAPVPSYGGTSFTGNRMAFVDAVEDSGGNVTGNLVYANGSSTNNLFADLSTATAASVNEFRLAVQTQRWYESLARSGNKYTDLVHGMFGVRGVSIPDRPEYLGGFTAPINMSQVASTYGDSQTGSLGDTGAFSLSNPGGYLFTKSFTEHGTLMVVACCRVRDSFAQGIQREDTRSDRFDFYWPQFANLGEQPILKRELYVNGSTNSGAFSSTDDEVFGYQEAWAEYRMFADQVRGYLNPTVSGGIGFYTYANNFSSAPSLKGYLNASSQKDIVDNTLTAKSSAVGFQLFGQFEFEIDMVRPMPTYSIPGLVDHH